MNHNGEKRFTYHFRAIIIRTMDQFSIEDGHKNTPFCLEFGIIARMNKKLIELGSTNSNLFYCINVMGLA